MQLRVRYWFPTSSSSISTNFCRSHPFHLCLLPTALLCWCSTSLYVIHTRDFRTVRLDTPHNWAVFWTDRPPICAPTIWPLTESVSLLIPELDGCVDSWMDVLTVYSEGLSRWSCSLCGVPFILSTEKLMEKGKTKKHQKSPFWTLCSFQKRSFNYMQRQMFCIWAHTTTMWQLQTLPVAGRNPLNKFFLSQQPLWHEIVDKHVCY